jgi:Pyruvate/2-oxoacid:ferredoxin oxidoreductase delta subunit
MDNEFKDLTNSYSSVLWDKCMGRGVCEGQCPNSAVVLICDERKGAPLDVRALS